MSLHRQPTRAETCQRLGGKVGGFVPTEQWSLTTRLVAALRGSLPPGQTSQLVSAASDRARREGILLIAAVLSEQVCEEADRAAQLSA